MTSVLAVVRRRLGGPASREAGFTLLEVVTTTLLLGIATALVVAPWRSFSQAQAQSHMAEELVSTLRNAQVSSVSELATYRVDVAAKQVKSYRITPGTGTAVLKQTLQTTSNSVSLTGASFKDASGAASTSVYFYPKGSASGGSVAVVRTGSSKTYTVTVEGLTARVTYTD
jgi:type II secretion system protein H